MADLQIDPFLSTEPEVEMDEETLRLLDQRLADPAPLIPGRRSTPTIFPVALKLLLYRAAAITELETIAAWSMEKTPGQHWLAFSSKWVFISTDF